MNSQPRQPKGTTSGGQFAGAVPRGVASITLTGPPTPGGAGDEEAALLARWAQARDPFADPRVVATLMDHHRQDPSTRHDTVNRGGRLVLTLAAGDPEPAIRAAAVGSPLVSSHARYALRRDVAAMRLTQPRPAHAR